MRITQRDDNESFKLRDLRESSVHSEVKLYFLCTLWVKWVKFPK